MEVYGDASLSFLLPEGMEGGRGQIRKVEEKNCRMRQSALTPGLICPDHHPRCQHHSFAAKKRACMCVCVELWMCVDGGGTTMCRAAR